MILTIFIDTQKIRFEFQYHQFDDDRFISEAYVNQLKAYLEQKYSDINAAINHKMKEIQASYSEKIQQIKRLEQLRIELGLMRNNMEGIDCIKNSAEPKKAFSKDAEAIEKINEKLQKIEIEINSLRIELNQLRIQMEQISYTVNHFNIAFSFDRFDLTRVLKVECWLPLQTYFQGKEEDFYKMVQGLNARVERALPLFSTLSSMATPDVKLIRLEDLRPREYHIIYRSEINSRSMFDIVAQLEENICLIRHSVNLSSEQNKHEVNCFVLQRPSAITTPGVSVLGTFAPPKILNDQNAPQQVPGVTNFN